MLTRDFLFTEELFFTGEFLFTGGFLFTGEFEVVCVYFASMCLLCTENVPPYTFPRHGRRPNLMAPDAGLCGSSSSSGIGSITNTDQLTGSLKRLNIQKCRSLVEI